ncbi:uncharacterized protein QC761_0027260 [Podospora bellae-mahoneyi]|uniref:Secreted protein n=1 Tax=Podospora bellae-mahoneyi TaxID=2093777 RepID=A0ABR0FV64_9PEZI|nr:hypothetical protein QC761_0027260 [Podospora bellae-mahoneyi]
MAKRQIFSSCSLTILVTCTSRLSCLCGSTAAATVVRCVLLRLGTASPLAFRRTPLFSETGKRQGVRDIVSRWQGRHLSFPELGSPDPLTLSLFGSRAMELLWIQVWTFGLGSNSVGIHSNLTRQPPVEEQSRNDKTDLQTAADPPSHMRLLHPYVLPARPGLLAASDLRT